VNQDGLWDAYDCRGDDLDCAGCDARFVNVGEPDSVSTDMIVDGTVANADIGNAAVTLGKIAAPGADDGKVLKINGTSMCWGTDEIGEGNSLWEQNGDDVYYDNGRVAIGVSQPDKTLHVNGDAKITGDLRVEGAPEAGYFGGRITIRNPGFRPHIHLEATDGSGSAAIAYRDDETLDIHGEDVIHLHATSGVVTLHPSAKISDISCP
jgi:hypothetical protein